LVFVVIAAAPSLGDVDLMTPAAGGAHGLATAAALAFFAFIGFEDLIKLAEETRRPERTMPRALLITWAIVTVIYVVVAITAVSAVPAAELHGAEGPLARVVAGRFGAAGVAAISIVALFSCANSILSNMLGSSRLLRG